MDAGGDSERFLLRQLRHLREQNGEVSHRPGFARRFSRQKKPETACVSRLLPERSGAMSSSNSLTATGSRSDAKFNFTDRGMKESGTGHAGGISESVGGGPITWPSGKAMNRNKKRQQLLTSLRFSGVRHFQTGTLRPEVIVAVSF